MNRLIHDYLNSKYNDVGLHECSPSAQSPFVYVNFTYSGSTGELIDAHDLVYLADLIGFMYEKFNPLPTKP